MTNSENCDAKTLAVIAAQFIALGADEEEALRKANALYLKATAYVSEEEMRALGDDLVIGDSDENSPALKYFRETAKTKKEANITHKTFLNIIKRFYDRRPEKKKTKVVPCPIVPTRIAGYEPVPWRLDVIGRGMLDELHDLLRKDRSQKKRSARHQKSGKKNLEAG